MSPTWASRSGVCAAHELPGIGASGSSTLRRVSVTKGRIVSVRIKVCGVLSADAAAAAADAGADLVGLNFVPSSPRCLSLADAEKISERLADTGAERVAVFKDAPWQEIERVTRRIDLERVQFHGNESEEDVEMVDFPVIKALRGADREAMEKYPGALLLLDHPTQGGGQGAAWNWTEAAELISEGWDVILAGGLNPENVGRALDDLGDLLPWGVDVATGVEGDDHRKDPAKMAAFVKAVRATEGSVTESGDS